MAAPVIQANYDDLAIIAGHFSQDGQAVQQLIQKVERCEQALESGDWIGKGAAAFFAKMQDLIFPAMHRLNGALNDACAAVGRISSVFHDAEEEASRVFQGDDAGETEGGEAFSSLFGGDAADDSDDERSLWEVPVGHAVDATKYTNGVDGWSTISMDGSKGFTPKELLIQRGPTCTIFGALNLLVASGYDIRQDGAETFAKIITMQEAWWRPDMWFDDEPNFGFSMDVSETVVGKYTPNYQRGDFFETTITGGFFPRITVSPNREKAEQFLVNTVRGGKPVLVSMEIDDSFGLGSGGHVATVLGVQTGLDGKLKSVLVSTNWINRGPVWEIPAEQFMDDWMDRKGGAYITVDRKPEPPPQPKRPNFSEDMLKILQEDLK